MEGIFHEGYFHFLGTLLMFLGLEESFRTLECPNQISEAHFCESPHSGKKISKRGPE